MNQRPDHIGIIGGGIIGLSIGWQLLRHGVEVTLFDKGEAGQCTSAVAAGMLAPQAEVGFEEIPLMKLGQASLAHYPRFLEELTEDAGSAPELNRCGTLLVGTDRDEAEILRRMYRFRSELALDMEWLSADAVREREPLLSPRVIGGVWLPEDAQLDNRALLTALRKAFDQRGGQLKEHTPVQDLISGKDPKLTVVLGDEKVSFDAIVIAAGAWSSGFHSPGAGAEVSVRPVKGQILTLEASQEVQLNAMLRYPRGYIVPKSNGTLRIGATSEEKGFENHPTAGGVKDILEEAWKVLPGIYDLPLQKIDVGVRPGSHDHAPLIGPGSQPGTWWATGHYRHGVLLAPVTAYGLVQEILSGERTDELKGFEALRKRTRQGASVSSS